VPVDTGHSLLVRDTEQGRHLIGDLATETERFGITRAREFPMRTQQRCVDEILPRPRCTAGARWRAHGDQPLDIFLCQVVLHQEASQVALVPHTDKDSRHVARTGFHKTEFCLAGGATRQRPSAGRQHPLLPVRHEVARFECCDTMSHVVSVLVKEVWLMPET